MTESERPVPAATLAKRGSKPFPGESRAYREARTALLAEEIELRRRIQQVAAQRRALPPGPKPAKDYRFLDADGKELAAAHVKRSAERTPSLLLRPRCVVQHRLGKGDR